MNLSIKERKVAVYKDKNILANKYYVEKKSLREISKDLGVGETVIHKWFHRFNLKIRSRSESLTGKPKTVKHVDNLRKVYSRWKIEGKFSGANNPRWKGGVHKINQQDRSKLDKIRREIKKKYNWTCCECGSKKDLHIHHIKSWVDYPELRFDTTNIICLCKTCHKIYHKYGTNSVDLLSNRTIPSQQSKDGRV